jgi:hypothetical protein
VFTTALINLSIALDSPGFRGLAAALLIFLLVIYFGNWIFTLRRVYTGVALGIPQEREREQQVFRREQQDSNGGTNTPEDDAKREEDSQV